MQLPKDIVDLSDPITRKAASANERLSWVCDQAKAMYGRDPRSGGFSFVGQPALIEYIVGQLGVNDRQMQHPIIIGEQDAEVVAWWTHGGARIPFRCSVYVRDVDAKTANLALMPDDKLVKSTMKDRMAAGDVRRALHKGLIRIVGAS